MISQHCNIGRQTIRQQRQNIIRSHVILGKVVTSYSIGFTIGDSPKETKRNCIVLLRIWIRGIGHFRLPSTSVPKCGQQQQISLICMGKRLILVFKSCKFNFNIEGHISGPIWKEGRKERQRLTRKKRYGLDRISVHLPSTWVYLG